MALTTETKTTRDRLIAVAQQMFFERGYKGTSLAAVAEQLNIKAPAVYYHFKSKLDLLYETQAIYTTSMIQELERATARGTAAERLRAFVRTHASAQFGLIPAGRPRYVFSVSQLIKVLEGEQREHLTRLSRRVLDLLREIIRQGVAEGVFDVPDPTVAAFAIIGMDHHLGHWYSSDGPIATDRLPEMHAAMALRMVGAAGRSRRPARPRPRQ